MFEAATRTHNRRVALLTGAALAALALLGALASSRALANSPITAFSVTPLSTQAGGHPDIVTHLAQGTRATQPPVPCNCNDPKELTVNTPPGLVAAPRDIPQCTQAEFSLFACSIDSQLGLLVAGGTFTPIYNLVPRPDELALLGGVSPGLPLPIVYVSISARTESDYGLEFKTIGLPRVAPYDLYQIVWGVPAAPIHDALRFPYSGGTIGVIGGCLTGDEDPLQEILVNQFPAEDCSLFDQGGFHEIAAPPIPANSPEAPFTSGPTTCAGPLTATYDTLAYDLGTDHAEAPYPATTGCEQLSFNPSLAAKPTTTEADSPSGLDIDLTVPQTLSPSTPTPSAIRDLTVELPPGFTVNPNAADGKSACTDAQANFGTRDPAQCPEFSKIGTAETISSSFPGALPGAMYLGEPLPGNRYRVFLTADGFSLHVKLAGTATLDPATGQVTTSFKDLPQFTFQEFNLHFFGAEKGLLATPSQCGTYPVKSTFTPWAYPSLPQQSSTQFFTIDSGPNGSPCPGATRPFDPSFAAGVTDNTAGHHSPFSLDVSRPDGDQNLTGLTVKTPPGFSADLRGIPYCPEAAIAQLQNSLYTGLSELAASACPEASRVGSVNAGAGAGSKPLYVGGKAYLAGPYQGAPLSLEVVIPAVSGPYDLGNVAVRAALNVDPITAQVTTVSDPLPQILQGIPLRTREVQVNLDRTDAKGNPDFGINPTNCDPFSVGATIAGDQGASADLSSPFQVANCADLGFGPKLQIKLLGHATNRNGHPALHATFTPQAGDANAKRVSVTLPATMQLDSSHIGSACTTPQFDANQCPADSVLGKASATLPILDKPLTGNVYLVTAGNRLPDLVMALRGQIDANLHGVIGSAPNGGLRNTFRVIPDVPVTSFTLDLTGGKKGLIVYNTDVCRNRKPALAQIDGQNGRSADQRVALHTACGSSARHRRKHRRHRRVHLPRVREASR